MGNIVHVIKCPDNPGKVGDRPAFLGFSDGTVSW